MMSHPPRRMAFFMGIDRKKNRISPIKIYQVYAVIKLQFSNGGVISNC